MIPRETPPSAQASVQVENGDARTSQERAGRTDTRATQPVSETFTAWVPALTPELIDRFWGKVTKAGPDECWMWQGACNGNGYGSFRVPGRMTVTASRYAYFIATKKWPGRYLVCHACDTPLCVNPAHLWLGLPADNTRDMVEKGRARNGDRRGSKNPRAKLSEDAVREIKRLIETGMSNMAIGERFSVHHSTVSLIRLGLKWKHVA